MTSAKKKKIKIILKNLKKVIKPRQIVLLIILLAGNTYAWFVYSNQVRNDIDVHVRSWKILFEANDTELSNYFSIDIADLYPGMDTFNESMTIENKSEVAAGITYSILEARIFDTTYITKEGRQDSDEMIARDDMSSEELEEYLNENYPFSISFNLTNDVLGILSTTDYVVSVEWPFESGNDEIDTYWGNEAYNFISNEGMNNPRPCMSFTIKVYVNQLDETASGD